MSVEAVGRADLGAASLMRMRYWDLWGAGGALLVTSQESMS